MKKTKMIRKNYEFKNVFANGKYFSGKYIEAFIQKDEDQENIFLGIAVGVKIAKAVKRNNIKRLIRECYYFYEPEILGGYHIIFLWKKKADIRDANFFNIKSDMKNIFIRAKMF